jgi:hypothetical protein
MKLGLLSTAAAFFLAMASQAAAELITNGTFESVSGGTFTGWSYFNNNSAVAKNQTGSVIAGSHSAEIVSGNLAAIYQSYGSLAGNTTYQFSLDFSVFACTSSAGRTFNVAVLTNATSGSNYVGINLRVGAADNGVTQAFQYYNGSSWLAVPGLATIYTTDNTANSTWGSGTTPAVNELTVTLHWNTSVSDSTYDITLNGQTTSAPLSTFVAVGTYTLGNLIAFQSYNGVSNYLVDNVSVSVVPEPNSLALLAVASLGLIALSRWKRRK